MGGTGEMVTVVSEPDVVVAATEPAEQAASDRQRRMIARCIGAHYAEQAAVTV